MGFSRENYRRIKHEYEGKALRAQEAAENRKKELGLRFPIVKELDEKLSLTGLRIYEASLRYKGARLEEELSKIKAENTALLKKRAEFLEENGIPADYSDVKYECEICSDNGFVGIDMCVCMKKRLIFAGYESSGIGALIRTKTFDNFNPSLQKDVRASESLSFYKDILKKYAATFEEGAQSLLFIGQTGLGKTHLSTALAGEIIGRGYDVVFETAQNMFSDFEFERFNRPYNSGADDESRIEKYFDCDLLIIDDLGTEMSNQFTVSCLYNVINTRLNRGKTIIINTNLTRDELNKRYQDRIASRLFGEFNPIMFFGHDVRGSEND